MEPTIRCVGLDFQEDTIAIAAAEEGRGDPDAGKGEAGAEGRLRAGGGGATAPRSGG